MQTLDIVVMLTWPIAIGLGLLASGLKSALARWIIGLLVATMVGIQSSFIKCGCKLC